MNRSPCRTLLLATALCGTASGQTSFSLQPQTSAEQGSAWKLPKVKLFETFGKAQTRPGALRNSIFPDGKRVQPNTVGGACGHIIIKPVDPNVDSKMVIKPREQTSRMPIFEGMPACSEAK